MGCPPKTLPKKNPKTLRLALLQVHFQPPDRRRDLWEPEPDPVLKTAVFTPEWTMCDSGRTAESLRGECFAMASTCSMVIPEPPTPRLSLNHPFYGSPWTTNSTVAPEPSPFGLVMSCIATCWLHTIVLTNLKLGFRDLKAIWKDCSAKVSDCPGLFRQHVFGRLPQPEWPPVEILAG